MKRPDKYAIGQYAVYLLCIATVVRLIRDMVVKWGVQLEPGIDFSVFIDAAQAFLRGANPYNPAELLLGRTVTPIVFPPQIILIAPFYLLSKHPSTIAFFALNIIVSFIFFKTVFKKLNLWHPPSSWPLSSNNQLFLLSLCLYFNSPALKHVLYVGQTSQIAFCSLFLALTFRHVFWRALFLTIALAAKISIVPYIGLAFLIIRDYRTCMLATAFFLGLMAAPALFGFNLITLYQNYVSGIQSTVGNCGFDTYCGGFGIDHLLQFDFFKIAGINTVVKAFFLICFAVAFLIEYRRKSVSLDFLLLANATMLVTSYHRFYDMTGLQLFMIVFMNVSFLRHRWVDGTIFTILLLLSLIPVPWMQAFGNRLGILIGENAWIYTASRSLYPVNFPIYGVYMFMVACFAVFTYFRRNSKIIFCEKVG